VVTGLLWGAPTGLLGVEFHPPEAVELLGTLDTLIQECTPNSPRFSASTSSTIC
jgi:hypothetical protein